MRRVKNKLYMAWVICGFLVGIQALAQVTETQVGNTITMDTVVPQTSGAWQSAQHSVIKVEVDQGDNVVIKMPSQALLAFSGFSTTTAVKKATIDVKLPNTANNSGEFNLFYYNNENQMTQPKGTPITLKNGGAYVFSDQQEIRFIADGTLKNDTWYTVERIWDYRKSGINMQRAAVYDQSGAVIGISPWTMCGTLESASSLGFVYPMLYFQTVNYSDYVMLDNLKLFNLVVGSIEVETKFFEEENRFILNFSEDMEKSSINMNTASLSVNNEDYKAPINYEFSFQSERQVVLTYNQLPYSEDISLALSTDIKTIDGWNMLDDKTFNFTTSEDPFFCQDATIVNEDMEATVTVELKNQGKEDRRYIFIVIARNQAGGISDMSISNGNVNQGKEKAVSQTVGKKNSQENVELHLWNNWYDMTPISVKNYR